MPSPRHGLEARIGVNTGEVVVGGQGETLVTGDAVNVAARLEQAAAPGTILIGGETRLLVRDAVRRRGRGAADAQGKVRARPRVPPRGRGRRRGAASLAISKGRSSGANASGSASWRDYEDAVADRACRLFTLLGPAGIGKSRLVADFLEHAGDDADVLRGRCLHYGEGITYWPLVEILIAAGDRARTRSSARSAAETQLAFRRLLEERARSGRRWWCWTISSGPSRRFSTSSSTSPISPATRRSSSSASRGRSSSTHGPAGEAGS